MSILKKLWFVKTRQDLHIVERCLIHAAAGSMLYLAAFWVSVLLGATHYAFAGAVTVAVIAIKEHSDMLHGQAVKQLVYDLWSWVIAAGLTGFLLYAILELWS